MSTYVLFSMDQPYRQWLIARHRFYVEQARKRLLSQFDDMGGDADRAADEWLALQGQHFDPDRDDEGDYYQRASDEAVTHYQLLDDMRGTTHLSVVAGIYHEWDKQLREWIVNEVLRWHRGKEVRAKIWSKEFSNICDLLAALGLDIRTKPYFSMLNACYLIVNVYKHGEGGSFEKLRQNYPEYLVNPLDALRPLNNDYTNHRDLTVNPDQIEAMSEAIVAFWTDVPASVNEGMLGKLPKWFENAIEKDRRDNSGATT
jgi:hypothetical protein